MAQLLTQITKPLKRFWSWLYGKHTEVSEMQPRDAFMAKIILETTQKTDEPHMSYVSLFDINQIHPITNRKSARMETIKRAKKVDENKWELLQSGTISNDTLKELMPSVTPIRVVPTNDGSYFSFEGNGRLAALKSVFDQSDDMSVEVEIFKPKNQEEILADIHKLRGMYKTDPDDTVSLDN
jgi:hypothetical protein